MHFESSKHIEDVFSKMAYILFQPQCVNGRIIYYLHGSTDFPPQCTCIDALADFTTKLNTNGIVQLTYIKYHFLDAFKHKSSKPNNIIKSYAVAQQ